MLKEQCPSCAGIHRHRNGCPEVKKRVKKAVKCLQCGGEVPKRGTPTGMGWNEDCPACCLIAGMAKAMTKSRRMDIWELLDNVSGQCLRLRDGVDALTKRDVRHDFLDHMVDLRDKLQQASELVEETIGVEA